MPDLIDKGVRQFVVYDCSLFDDDFLLMLAQNRPLPQKRDNIVKKEDKIVVISQDCDINSVNQEYIEFVILRDTKRKKVKGGSVLEKTRSFEKLLLPLYSDFQNGYTIFADEKCSLLKVDFANQLEKHEITPWLSLLDRSREILMKWLVNKYLRRPFPHKFNTLFTFKYLKDGQDSFFNLFETHSGYINEIYFYVSPYDIEDAGSYFISVTALLHSNCPTDIRDVIDRKMEADIKRIQNEYIKTKEIIMLQALDEDDKIKDDHILELSDYTVMPDAFTKSAEYQMLPMSVDYLCWKGGEFEIP